MDTFKQFITNLEPPKEDPVINPPVEEDLDSHTNSFSWADFVLRREKNRKETI